MALRKKLTTISRIPLILGLALGVAVHATPASATVIGFDDILVQGQNCTAATAATSGVPDPYYGLHWVSDSGSGTAAVGLECDAHYAGGGSFYGNTYTAPSPDFAAYNSSGFVETRITPVSGTFDFLGADFTSFAFANAFVDPYSAYSVRIEGYYMGNLVDSVEFDLSSTAYVSHAFGTLIGLDRLSIFAGSDVIANSPGFGNNGWSFLFDNVNVELHAVPEPGTALLLLAGLVAIARNPKRRRA